MNIKALKGRDLKLICESFLFRGISQEAVLDLCGADNCALMVFEKGKIIYSSDNYLKSCGLILSGSVLVSKPSPGGHELLMNTLARGSLFGAAALWAEHEGYVTTLTAVERCRVLFFSQELLESNMKSYPELALNYIRFLSGRVWFLNDKIQSLIAGSAVSSLSQYLADCFDRLGTKFRLEVSLSALAGVLNIARASLYRSFDCLSEEGVIERNGRDIAIIDVQKLRRFHE